MSDAIADYANKLDSQRAGVCATLAGCIGEFLPQATGKLWHAIPVWFIGDNPVVGYTARKTGVMLMFWNGQHFGEAELEASGSFHMAQIAFNDASEIDRAKLAGWLQKAGASIWDMKGERDAFVAKRRAAKAKAKSKAKPKAAKPRKAAAKKSAPKKAARSPVKKAKVAKRKSARPRAGK